MGTWMGMAYSTSISFETGAFPARIIATSVEVPPMSYVSRSGIPARRPVATAAITPEAGPDITVLTASFDTDLAETMPPLPFITKRS